MNSSTWFSWVKSYNIQLFKQDTAAAFVVTLILIPQALAYAQLAGLPPAAGVLASVLPALLYASLGKSSVLAVGPVALMSLMSAEALGSLELSPDQYLSASALLAFFTGVWLIGLGLLRAGGLTHLISHPVITSFVSAAAVLIVFSQLKTLLGLKTFEFSLNSIEKILYSATALIGLLSLAVLMILQSKSKDWLTNAGLSKTKALGLSKLAPLVVLVIGSVVAAHWFPGSVALVGDFELQIGFPSSALEGSVLKQLFVSAGLVAVICYVESYSIAHYYSKSTHDSLQPNTELKALGAANLGSAVLGGLVVSGGFSRTLVSAEAGTKTQASAVASGLLVLPLAYGAAHFISNVPLCVLAAVVIAAAVKLISLAPFRHAYQHDKADFMSMLLTFFGVLTLGVEAGLILGLLSTVVSYLWQSATPHMAQVGLVPGTQYFRNIHRHQVQTHPSVLLVRSDENLVFHSSAHVVESVLALVEENPCVNHVVLILSSVSRIDLTGLEALEDLNDKLAELGVSLHLAAVKGPVADRLLKSPLAKVLQGQVFLTAYEAWQKLTKDT